MNPHNTEQSQRAPRRLATIREIPTLPPYSWTTQSFLRHAIFNSEDRVGSPAIPAFSSLLNPDPMRQMTALSPNLPMVREVRTAAIREEPDALCECAMRIPDPLQTKGEVRDARLGR